MKRIIEFQISDDKYVFLENQKNIFEIRNDDLQVDVKKFYNAFFENNLDYSDIELHNSNPGDKTGGRVFGCIKQLIDEVSTRLIEEFQNQKCEDTVETIK
ncbi:hypothetical protein [Anaerosinus gibii]|uniref:Uncharacterized protein n=1 Tax=Selenobaculum gibii TaxID=3054208 RepID=A0A9Y2AJX8_9FIRM|nr:hypothetical protein [Selenobaculum gbiensis]WIW71471.1 hypothetical protein P3F81_03965 [Selenobaculum gbiensis]